MCVRVNSSIDLFQQFGNAATHRHAWRTWIHLDLEAVLPLLGRLKKQERHRKAAQKKSRIKRRHNTTEKSEWHALYVRPRFERVAAFYLQIQNIEHYLPLRRITRQSASGVRAIELPLLPRYVFCKAHARMSRSMLIPGVIDVVGGPIPRQKIDDLKRIIATGLAVQQLPVPPIGKTLKIGRGALEGITGVLDSTRSGACIFVISIEAIRGWVGVQIGDQYTFEATTNNAVVW